MRLRSPLAAVEPTAAERSARLPGDEIVAAPDVVMDRAFDLPAPPAAVWPWLVQLGKGRAGWYLPRTVERLVPASRRALRRLDPALQSLAAGDVVPDWGGAGATFTIEAVQAPTTLVHSSTRGRMRISWTIAVRPAPAGARVHMRLRLGGVRRKRLAAVGGGAFDALTIAGLAAGLRERVRPE